MANRAFCFPCPNLTPRLAPIEPSRLHRSSSSSSSFQSLVIHGESGGPLPSLLHSFGDRLERVFFSLSFCVFYFLAQFFLLPSPLPIQRKLKSSIPSPLLLWIGRIFNISQLWKLFAHPLRNIFNLPSRFAKLEVNVCQNVLYLHLNGQISS